MIEHVKRWVGLAWEHRSAVTLFGVALVCRLSLVACGGQHFCVDEHRFLRGMAASFSPVERVRSRRSAAESAEAAVVAGNKCVLPGRVATGNRDLHPVRLLRHRAGAAGPARREFGKEENVKWLAGLQRRAARDFKEMPT